MKMLLLVAALGAVGPLAYAEELPVPPIPPALPNLADAAPVPNVDAQAPMAPGSDQPSINMRLYRARTYDPAGGFVPGSRYQSSEDRKAIQTPGFSINVPLK
jgi:hypothetical protein